MSNGKHSHAWTVAIVAVCLLFTQLATAAYVCPRLGNASNPVVNEVVTTIVDCDSMPNGQLDMDQPGLCKAHCQTVQQSHESKNKFNVESPTLDVLWTMVWIFQSVSELSTSYCFQISTAVRPPGSPSLYLVNQVFRL